MSDVARHAHRDMSGVATELRSRFGDELLLPAGENGRPASLRPIAAPTHPDQLAELMALCSERGWPVYAAGAGTWPRGTQVEDGLIVTTQRLVGITEHEPEDLVVGVRAGTSLETLQAGLGDSRQFLPLDPPALSGATIGATVALRCAGPLRAGYGTPRDLVLGLELVTGDGRRLRFGGRVVKNVAGYDGVRLVTGSRGRLGIITAVFVRVRSLPRMDRTLALPADAPGHAAALALACRDTAHCEALEILSPGLAALLGLADRWHVLARLHGSGDDVAERYGRLATAAASPSPAPGEPSPAMAWGRLARIEAAAAPALEVSVTPGAVGALLRSLAAGAPGWAAAAHATEAVIRAWPLDATAPPLLPEALKELRDAAATAGGTVRWLVPPAAAAAARATMPPDDPVALLTHRIVAAFDPAGILGDAE